MKVQILISSLVFSLVSTQLQATKGQGSSRKRKGSESVVRSECKASRTDLDATRDLEARKLLGQMLRIYAVWTSASNILKRFVSNRSEFELEHSHRNDGVFNLGRGTIGPTVLTNAQYLEAHAYLRDSERYAEQLIGAEVLRSLDDPNFWRVTRVEALTFVTNAVREAATWSATEAYYVSSTNTENIAAEIWRAYVSRLDTLFPRLDAIARDSAMSREQIELMVLQFLRLAGLPRRDPILSEVQEFLNEHFEQFTGAVQAYGLIDSSAPAPRQTCSCLPERHSAL